MHQEFLDFLLDSEQRIFIDVEGKRDKMENFITQYNTSYSESIAIGDDGICLLSDTVDKWSVELRIYFNDTTGMPVYWDGRKYRNRNYRSDEFDYRLDDNKLMWFLFDNGYRVGYN